MFVRHVLLLFVLAFTATDVSADRVRVDSLLHRIFDFARSAEVYADTVDTTYSYIRYKMEVQRRNVTLMAVPTMYVVAHGGQRKYYGESAFKMLRSTFDQSVYERLAGVTNIPHRRRVMDVLVNYLLPTPYQTTLIDNNILSPFNKANRKFYKYGIRVLDNGMARLSFHRKHTNTQLVNGMAVVEYATGRIVWCEYSGEYDMISFTSYVTMGTEGKDVFMPKRCEVESTFRFMGNKVSGNYVIYNRIAAPDSLKTGTGSDFDIIERLRPDKLTEPERMVFEETRIQQARRDSIRMKESIVKKRRSFTDFMWDVVGDNLLNKIKGRYGDRDQGYFRFNPIFNPLYMSYDNKRGVTYKFDFRTSYNFSPNAELYTRIRAAYSFRLKRLSYNIPVYLYLNKRNNTYISLEINNGRRINNSVIQRTVSSLLPDSMRTVVNAFSEFSNNETKLNFSTDIGKHFGIQLGLRYLENVSVNKKLYRQVGYRYIYRSMAPLVELQIRPAGYTGPIITIDYDHGLKNIFRSNMDYERWEGNMEYIHRLDRLQSLQMRFGAGMYTRGQDKNMFLTYENFNEENIPGGWNDDWTGEFELLKLEDYNLSNYYVRANLTYESPLLLLSKLPVLGQCIELERIYVSALSVRNIQPYVELGYGFSTRLFSVGMFVANRQGRFDGFGCKFGFELFRRW